MKLFFLVILLSSVTFSVQAQLRLHDKERDEQAKKALELVEGIGSGDVFQKQLKNLSVLVRKDFETQMTGTRRQINFDLINTLSWHQAHERVCEIEKTINLPGAIGATELREAIRKLEAAIAKAKQKLADLKSKIPETQIDPSLAAAFEQLGEFTSLLELVKEFGPGDGSVEAITKIESAVNVLTNVYSEFETKVEQFNQLQEQLAEFKLTLKRVAIQSLQVHEEHLKNLAEINARREKENAQIAKLLASYRGSVYRLGLLPKKDSLCDAIAAAEAENSPFQHLLNLPIATHLKNVSARARFLEKNNQKIIQSAQQTLFEIRQSGSFNSSASLSLQEFMDALNELNTNINSANQLHQHEAKIKAAWDDYLNDFRSELQSNNPSQVENALLRALTVANVAGIGETSIARISRLTNFDDNYSIRGIALDAPTALFTYAALLARGQTPTELAELRTAQELHAYSIKKSAVEARAYELTVSTGVQRLALYHQGGIKPELIAQLIFAVSNVAITPAILAQ